MNAVLGSKETETFQGHEIGVLFEVIAVSQEVANSICATVRSTFLHFGYENSKYTAGYLCFRLPQVILYSGQYTNFLFIIC